MGEAAADQMPKEQERVGGEGLQRRSKKEASSSSLEDEAVNMSKEVRETVRREVRVSVVGDTGEVNIVKRLVGDVGVGCSSNQLGRG